MTTGTKHLDEAEHLPLHVHSSGESGPVVQVDDNLTVEEQAKPGERK